MGHGSETSIDVHAHAVLEMTLGAAGDAGPDLGADENGSPWFRVGEFVLRGVRYRDSPFMDVALRLAAMDRAGIDRQLLSPNPITFFGALPAGRAVAYARAHNEALAEIVATHPDRLLGAAQLPMQDIDAAIAEIEYAVRELGLVAAYIDTDPGRALDDRSLDAFYEAVADLDVPLFVHPSPLGGTGPPDDPRLRRYDLEMTVGFAYDETLAVAALILGGVLDRHPGLDVVVSHGGGTAPFLAERLARACERRPWATERLRERGFRHYLRRLWFDTHVHGPGALALLVEAAGTERLVLGTNFAGWDSGHAADHGELGPVLSGNAARLLRLDRPDLAVRPGRTG